MSSVWDFSMNYFWGPNNLNELYKFSPLICDTFRIMIPDFHSAFFPKCHSVSQSDLYIILSNIPQKPFFRVLTNQELWI